jgi:hypothetical protein
VITKFEWIGAILVALLMCGSTIDLGPDDIEAEAATHASVEALAFFAVADASSAKEMK